MKIKSILFSIVLIIGGICNAQSFSNNTQNLTAYLRFAEISESHGVALIGGGLLYKSIDNGYTFSEINSSFSSNLFGYYFWQAAIINNQTYCVIGEDTFDGTFAVLRTIDGGLNWAIVFTTIFGDGIELTDINYNGNSMAISATNGIYFSSNNGLSWTYNVLSSGSEIAPFIQFNSLSGDWITTDYSLDFNISANNGISWSNQVIPSLISTNISSASNQGGNLLFCENQIGSTGFFEVNGYLISDSLSINNQYFSQSNIPCTDAFYLPNGNILTHDDLRFFIIDTSTHFVYHINHQLLHGAAQQWAFIKHMEIDQTYGLVVGEWGAVSRIDLSQANEIYVPANFTVTTMPNCPGDLLVANIDNPFADSLNWFFNGNLISNNNSISYNIPLSSGSFNLVLQTWAGGNNRMDSVQITIAAPLQPLTFNFNIDSSICYNNGTSINFNNLPSLNNNTFLEVILGTQNIYGPTLLPASNFNIPLTNLTQDDTLWLITSRPQTCYTTYDTAFVTIDISDNLSNFSLLPYNNSVCSDAAQVFEFYNLVNNANYLISRTCTVYNPITDPDFIGLSSDTLGITVDPIHLNANNNPINIGSIYAYYSITVSDQVGCSVTEFLDSILIQRSTSIFFPHSRSFYMGDTIQITNAQITSNRLWELQGLPPTFISNETDTVPQIIADTLGFYAVTLTNNPLPGCADSSQNYIHICDSLPLNPNAICTVVPSTKRRNLHETYMDNDGNNYVIGVTNGYGQHPGYIVSKYDTSGLLVWEKKSGWVGSWIDGVVVEGLDFDNNGDLYCALWIQSGYPYTDDWISYTPISPSIQARSYIVKVDKMTGDVIWSSDITQYPVGWLSSYLRITDLAINNDTICFSTYSNNAIVINAMDINANFISGSNSFIYIGGVGALVPVNFHIPYGSLVGPGQSNWSPRLEVLSTGEIIGVAYYDAGVSGMETQIPELYFPSESMGLMAFKYRPNLGIYSKTRIAELGFGIGTSGSQSFGSPQFGIDINDDITFAIKWQTGDTIRVLDSTLTLNAGTALLKTNSDFQMEWLTTGTYAEINDLKVAKNSGQIFLSGKTKDNLSFGNNENHKMFGNYGTFSPQYSLPPYQWELADLNFNFNLNTIGFVAEFNSLGIPQNANTYEILPNYSAFSIQLLTSVSPCGDLSVFINDKASPPGSISLNSNGINYDLDSGLVLNYHTLCSISDCLILDLPDSSITCGQDTITTINVTNEFLVDSISYDVIQTGNIIASGTTSIINNEISFSFPSGLSGNYSIVLDSPVIDTISGFITNPMQVSYSFNDSICYGSIEVINALPNDYNYTWLSDSFTGQNLSYSPASYLVGANYIDVTITDTNGCQLSSSLYVNVWPDIAPTIQPNYSVACEDSLVISYNDQDYLSSVWYDGLQVCNNFFSSDNCNIGSNVFGVDLIDTNNCLYVSNFNINYCYDLGIEEELEENLISIFPNPNNGSFILKSKLLEEANIQILSCDGKLIEEFILSNNNEHMIFLNAEPGVYFLNINNLIEQYSLRFIINE